MADNCSSLEPWSFYSISDAFACETEAFTRALQMSFSSDADVLAAVVSGGASPLLLTSDPGAASLSASDAEPAPKRARAHPVLPVAPAGKISKRKRPSKRSTTTYITADPANFRQMVQQVTGIRLGGAPHEAAESVLKPEPQRPGGNPLLQGSCLPTLDTSSFLLEQAAAAAWAPAAPSPPSHASSFGSSGLEGAGFDLDPAFSCFPTLESWGAM
uniref:Translation initiation factor IF-2 n=1 Tax=Anthurium amnicola TaxID=1678845 RepID=A0A1D1Y307_9ARAE